MNVVTNKAGRYNNPHNYHYVTVNEGTVTSNYYRMIENDGTVTINKSIGRVDINSGTVTNNFGSITTITAR